MSLATTIDTLFLVSIAVYAVAAVLFTIRLRRLPDLLRPIGYALVGMVCIAGLSTVFVRSGAAVVPVGTGSIDLAALFDDLIAYSLVFVVTTLVSGARPRTALLIGALSGIMRLSFEISAVTEGVVSLLAALVMPVGYLVQIALFWGPVKRVARAQQDGRWLLYWKCRNLIIFLNGMLIAVGIIALTMPDATFLLVVLSQYLKLLIKVGFTAFVLVNIGSIGEVTTVTLSPAETGAVGAE